METGHWTKQIDEITNGFRGTFGPLTDKQLNWKPDHQTWSIAQNMDHVIVLNESYYPVLNALRNGTYKTPFIGRLGFIPNFFGKLLLKAVQPDRKRKMKTFPVWEPAQGTMLTGILEKFEAHQEELKRQIENSKELKKETVISSPANKNIVYTLESAFDIIVTHEQRHFQQAKEVLEILPE